MSCPHLRDQPSFELLPANTNQGIGFDAISAMLSELRKRLGVFEYRVRIEPTNHASQRLFEKLGAIPNGISELWVHDQKDLEQLENDSTLLFIDTNGEYQKGQLNVFKYKAERTPQYKLSRRRVPQAAFVGKVLMAVNQY